MAWTPRTQAEAVTHIDALCHVSYDDKLYNNRVFGQYLNSTGASWVSLAPWFEGVTTLRVFTAMPLRLVGSTRAPAHPLAIF